MRNAARLVAACTTSLLIVGLAPGIAHAASVVHRTPAAGAHVNVMPLATYTGNVPDEGTGIVVQYDGPVLQRTIEVTPPSPNNAFSCPVTSPSLGSDTISCAPTMSGNAAFPQGTYTVHTTGTVTLPGVPGPVDDTATFVYDSIAPAVPTSVAITPSPYYTKADKDANGGAGRSIVINGNSESQGDTVTVTLSSNGGGTTQTATTTAGVAGAFGVSFAGGSVPDGTLTATATSTDLAGNTGLPATAPTVQKDTVLPVLVDTAPANNGFEKSKTGEDANGIIATGSEPLGAATTVVIRDSLANIIPTTSTITTNSVKTVPSGAPLLPGTYTATINLADLVGNPASQVVRTFTIDDSAPGAPGFSASLAPISIANASAYTVTGTGEPGATVTVTFTDSAVSPTSLVSTAVVAGNGAWALTRSVATLADGDVNLTATQQDAAGNVSLPPNGAASVTKDTVAPRVTNQAFAQQRYKDATPQLVVVTGKVDNGTTTAGESGDDVQVTITDVGTGHVLGTTQTLSDGTFSVSVDVGTLGDGLLTAHVVAFDQGTRNPSAEKTATTILDTGAPALPTLTATNPVNAAHAAIVAASGTTEPYATVTVTVDDADAGTPAATGSYEDVAGAGTYTVSPLDTSGLHDGTLTVTAQAADQAGNLSAIKSISITKDTAAPLQPSSIVFGVGTPSYVKASNATAVPVSGVAETGSSVLLHVTDTGSGMKDKTVTATGGAFSTTIDLSTLADGVVTLTVTATDVAGNSSDPATKTSTKDTVAPGVPVNLAVSPSPMDLAHATSDLVVTGNTATGADRTAEGLVAVITLIDDDATTDNVTGTVPITTGTGAFTTSGVAAFANSAVLALSDGLVTVQVTVQDPAGNTGTAGTTSFVKDTTELAMVSAAPADLSSHQSVSEVLITMNEALVTSTTVGASPYSRVSVTNTLGNPVLGSIQFLPGNQAMRFTPSSAFTEAASPYTVTVHAADANDTADTFDQVLQFTVDATAPVAPTITSVTDPVTAASKTAVAVSGNAGESGLTVSVTVSGASGTPVTKSATSTAGGAYTVSGINVTNLPDGTLSVVASSTDAALNAGPASAATTTTKDATLPVVSPLSATSTDYAHPSTTVTGAVSEPVQGSTVALSATDGTHTVTGSAPVTAGGTFTGSLSTLTLDGGLFTVTVTATDLVGNPGTASVTTTRDAATPPTVAPTGVSAVAKDRAATVSFTGIPSSGNGGASVTSYSVLVTNTATSATSTFTGGSASPITVTGLTNGALYSFQVRANNRVGAGPLSTASTAVKPMGSSSVTLASLPTKVVAGTIVKLSGKVTRTDTSVAAAQVVVKARTDAGTVLTLAKVTPSSTGAWAYSVKAVFNRTYSVAYPGDSRNKASVSVGRRVLAAAKVTASAPTGSHTVNQVITGSVYPNKAGKTVTLYRVTSTGSLVKLASVTLSSTSTYRFSVRLKAGYTTLRVVIGATPNNAAGYKQFRAYRS